MFVHCSSTSHVSTLALGSTAQEETHIKKASLFLSLSVVTGNVREKQKSTVDWLPLGGLDCVTKTDWLTENDTGNGPYQRLAVWSCEKYRDFFVVFKFFYPGCKRGHTTLIIPNKAGRNSIFISRSLMGVVRKRDWALFARKLMNFSFTTNNKERVSSGTYGNHIFLLWPFWGPYSFAAVVIISKGF